MAAGGATLPAMLPPLLGRVLDNFNFDIDPDKSTDENVEDVIKSASLLSGAIAIEPVPFADILLITPVQAKMVLHIGKIYGFEITPARSREIMRELGVTVAYGMAARQVMRGVIKAAVPVVGGIVTSPMVYGWTFALGRLAERHFQARVAELPFSKTEARAVAQQARQESRRILPSSEDFGDLASELRRRAEARERELRGEERERG